MNANPSLVFSILLLTVIVSPAFAQTANSVVINELDINPPGDDSTSIAEWVELYNPTDSEIDLSGWEIASTTVLQKTMTIPNGVTIQPGEFLTYSYQPVWFTDSGESVELRDDNGFVVDKTPMLIDIKNDFTSWQRIYDGYGLDASGDWKFVNNVRKRNPDLESFFDRDGHVVHDEKVIKRGRDYFFYKREIRKDEACKITPNKK